MRYFLCPCGGSIKVQGTCFICEKCSAALQLRCTFGHSLLPDISGSVPTFCIECQQEITTETICVAVQQRVAGENASGSCYDVGHNAKARLGRDVAPEGVATGCALNSASQHDDQPDFDRAISSNSAVTDSPDNTESDNSDSSEDENEMCSTTGGIASSDSSAAHAASESSTYVDLSPHKPEGRRTRRNRKKKEKKKKKKASAAANASSGAAEVNASSGATAANASSDAAAAQSFSGVAASKASSGTAAAKASAGAAATKASAGAAAAKASSGAAATNPSSGATAANASSGRTAADALSTVTAGNASSAAGSSIHSNGESTTKRGNGGAESSATENFPAPAVSGSSEISRSSAWSNELRDEAVQKEVPVTFEIVVPQSFCNGKPAAVHIEFYDSGKFSSSHTLSYQRLSSNRHGWTTSVNLPRTKLRTIQYRYCTVDKDQKKLFEHIHRDDNGGTDFKRRLILYDVNCQNISHLYQYDLAMLPKKYPKRSGNLLKRFTAAVEKFFNFDDHLSEQLFEDSVYGLECMLPDIVYCLSNHTMNGADIMAKIRRIVVCVSMSDIFFLNYNRKWTNRVYFKEAIGWLFCSQLQSCQRFLDAEPSHKPELFNIYRIISVLIMLVIMHDLKNIQSRSDLDSPAELMEHIDWRNVSIRTLLDEIRNNLLVDRQLYDVLDSFLNLLAVAGRTSWLLGIPAYHALGRYNTSCDKLKYDRCAEYWGFNVNLERAVEYFKRTVKETDIARLLEKLEHAFHQQPLSARSLIGALNMKTVLYALNQCWRLPIDAYMPAVLYFALYSVKQMDHAQSQELACAFEALLTYTDRRLAQLLTRTSDTTHQEVVISLEILSAASIELGRKLTPDNWDCSVALVQLATCLCRYAVRDSSTVEVCASAKGTITSLVKRLMTVQQNHYCSSIPDNELKMWEALHMVTWPDGDSQESWTLLLNKSLASRVHQISGRAKIDLYFSVDSRSAHVKKILADAACSAAAVVLQDPDVIKTDSSDVEKFTRYGWLLSMVFADSWKKEETDADKILFILLSPVFRTCFAFSRNAQFSALEAECQEYLAQCISLFEDLVGKLKDGRLTYGIFGLMIKHEQSFLQVHKLLSKGCESSADEDKYDVSFCLEHHRREKQQFDELRSNLEILRALCQDLESVQIQDFDNLSKDFNEMEIRLLWRPAMSESGNMANFFECDPFKVVRSTIPPTLLAKVKDVHRSVIFTKMWKEAYGIHARYEEEPDGEPDRKYGDEQVVAVLLSTAQEQWQSFADRFNADSATFQDATRLLRYCGNDMRCVEREISIFVGTSKSEATGKLLQQYYHLLQCRDGAKAILQIKDRLRLTGDFNIVSFIVNMKENKECKLSSIPDVLHQVALQYLPDLGRACNTRCLVEFASCMDLVLWVQEHIHNLKELKVFVDLASIAAGEGDIEVEKVSCLHASITGFSPLIYDLHPNADLDTFLEKCRVVWRNLSSNASLPEQLKATSDNIHWVQHIKDSYGSVEVSSLAQASAINESGIFEVGCIEDNFGANSFSLEGVMRVTIPPTKTVKTHGLLQTNAGIAKTYNYSHLCELQSKLMLVAGKAEQDNPDVHIFVKMFANATRLANAYINMHNTGNILFDTWKARFYCGASHSVNVHVEFGLAKKVIRGLSDIPCEDHAMQLAMFMEQCIEKWKDYALEKRGLFSELNFFTTQQIVFLRRELAKLLHKKNCDQKVYPLLSMARPCDREDVLKALDEADESMVANVNAVPEIQQEAHAQAAEIQPEPVLSDEQQTMLTMLLDFDINKQLAVAALAACPGCSITDIVQWCQDKSVTSESAQARSKPVILNSNPISRERRSAATIHSLPSLLSEILVTGQEENFAGGVCALLTEIWSRYLNHASTSLNDFLSLDHLGHVLRLLVQEKAKMTNKRKTPPGMNRGRICLATCTQDAMLMSVMAVYAVDGRCPLPTRNEVLLCTGHTTTEEVGLFLDRASTDDESIYCLAYADRLNYETCAFIERRVGNLQDCRTEYLIVVLCCEEKSLSPITTILERWKLNSGILCDMEHIRKYVRQRLCVDEESRRVAAMLDNDQSSTRLIRSQRAGVGKSLYVQRTVQRLKREVTSHADPPYVYIPLLQQRASPDVVLEYLLPYSCQPGQRRCRIIHIDVTPEVQEGVSELLFDLLILGSVCQKDGYVWQRSLDDYYMVEFTSFQPIRQSAGKEDRRRHHEITELLPSVECYSPQECLEQYNEVAGPDVRGVLMDDGEFQSRSWQRVYQHLTRLDGDLPFTDVEPSHPEGTHQQMLETLLRHCGIKNPSWAELKYFVLFLNRQLEDCTVSSFCSKAAANELPGFIKFVVKFMLQMSMDFATRSLFISEESPHMQSSELQQTTELDAVHGMTLKRRWEQSSHPYLFFNSDGHTLTFLGFCVDPANGNIIEPKTRQVLEKGAMTRSLFQSLKVNNVDLSEDFEELSRQQQILKLCSIMGNPDGGDPDETYKLTLDNVKKLLAIYMRFRCGIPVVIMGETGCGKTRLVKFMCGLQQPQGSSLRNLLLVKIHGGVTFAHLKGKVAEAYRLAKENRIKCPHMYTVLFLDEANTTDAIGLIKEVMCDGSLDGNFLDMTCGLRIVAAVNPYRKHPETVIKKLESAGLGYYVRPEDTADRFGSIPMRQLVYRVRSLPPSILPLVWDFGQLSAEVERIYILQMVEEHARNFKKNDPRFVKAVADVLVQCQKFMRAQEDECCFVSLRDAERALQTMSWFLEKCKLLRQTAVHQHGALAENAADFISREDDLDDMTWSFVLALGVCYQACLLPQSRKEFQCAICPYFLYPLMLPGGERQFSGEIEKCQTMVIDSLSDHIPNNIARNRALKENILMMIVCMELRIPLFLIGKPGSSKSLAKAILADAMQGDVSKSNLFKHLKQTHMVSFQCSPLATPEGIVGTFKQAARFQKSRPLDKFVSVVVLDEIGLAEDSKLMPLKTLHPLLEDGCEGDEEPELYMKCAFIGISNWSLDPAKMNRGIMVQRGVPTRKELEESARGICKFYESVLSAIAPVIPSLAAAYLDLFTEVATKREFFGLRDFYSLMKMVAYFANEHGGLPHAYEFQHAVRRNFGGSHSCNAVEVFEKHLRTRMDVSNLPYNEAYPPCDAIGLIRSSLNGEYTSDGGESRYLLILSENYSVLNLIQGEIQKMNPQIIFGSSFPKDLLYTQVCRNINRIKVCMETGTPVMLLNLEHLYESLYDALNQYYVYYGGKRFVDLGLGTHRVKCRVHERFRLIVVARKDDVHNKYPIPLINRLEKHYISMNTMLTPEQKDVVQKLDQWAIEFTSCSNSRLPRIHQRSVESRSANPGEVFVGLTPDTFATLVIKVTDEMIADGLQLSKEEVQRRSEKRLLSIATPESVLRIKNSFAEEDYNRILEIYFKEQQHDCLVSYLKKRILADRQRDCFLQVTTRSKLLSEGDVNVISAELNRTCFVDTNGVELIAALQAMDTEHQFSERVRNFFRGKRQPLPRKVSTNASNDRLLIIQCEAGDDNLKLVECARHILSREYNAIYEEDGDTRDHRDSRAPLNRHIVLVIRVTHRASFAGFYGGVWECVHIDDLRAPSDFLPDICEAQRNSLSQLLNSSLQSIRRCNSEDDSAKWQEFDHNDVDVKQVDIVELLKICLHEAASRLRDSSSSSDRPQERIRILCELLSVNGSMEFCHLVASSVVELFHSREHTTSHFASHWLVTDAAAEQSIARLGTFRRSLEDCLARKIAPTFAAVIAYCDVNDGLDLVDPVSENYAPWVASLWLKIFASFCLSGSSMMASFPEQYPSELPVLCKSATGQAFKSIFPFSWVIKEKFDALSKQTSSSQGTRDVLEALLASDEEFGDKIRALSKEQLQESIRRYAHDYLYMMHRCNDREEYELVLSALLRSMRSGHVSNILDVHSCFSDNRPAIVRWSRLMDATLTSARAEIFANVRRSANDEEALWDTHTIDIMGLREVLRVLEKKSHLESRPGGKSNPAKEWSSSVHRLHSITKEILAAAQVTQSNSCVVFECRKTWSRLEAVKLFVEYIVAPEALSPFSSPAFEMKHAKLFLTALCGDKDFNPKTLSSFLDLEKFLTFCHGIAVSAIYGTDAGRRKCYSCGAPLMRAVLLPCRHLVCSPCLHRFYQLNNQFMKCPQCSQTVQFGEAVVPANEHDRASYERLKQLMQRLSDLFIRLLSDLVFDGVNRPEEPLLRHLLSYVIVSQDETNNAVAVDASMKALTTQLGIYIDASLVDPRPVVRSLLLQLILQSSQGQMDVIATFFEKATAITKQDNLDAELCTIFINCIEDYYYRQVNFVDHDNSRDANDSTMYIISTLRRGTAAWHVFDTTSVALTVDTLSSLAKVRLALALVAGVLCQQILSKSLTSSTSEVIDVLRQFCDHAERHARCPWPRIFLSKHMIRKRGASTVLGAMAEPSLRQLMPRELQEAATGETLSDPFVIGNNNEVYCAVRKALSSCIIDGKPGDFDHYLRVVKAPDSAVDICVILALCSVITRTYYSSNADDLPKPQTINMLRGLVKACPRIRSKELCEHLLTNSLPEKLCLIKEMGLPNAMIALLVLRLWAVLSHVSQRNSLLVPLSMILTQPRAMQGKFFPTMPHDQFLDIRHVMQAMVRPGENLTPHACPNGHIYYIGNCGRAYSQSQCPDCRSSIGGSQHVLSSGNRKIDPQEDQTKPGHILGPVTTKAHQQNLAVAERDLTPASCCIARILLHMAMYAGSARNGPQHVSTLISPTPPDIFDFLWKHICNDLNTMERTLNKSRDECVILLHTVIAGFVDHSTSGNFDWNTHERRRNWEAQLHQKVIAPCVQNCNDVISAATEQLQADAHETGSTVALAKLLEEPNQPLDVGSLLSNAVFWRYRERPGLDHFLSELENYVSSLNVASTPPTARDLSSATERYAYLLKFLRSHELLAAVSHLPAVMTTISLLHQEFSRKLSTHAMDHLSIESFLATSGRSCSHLLEPIIKHFIDAWNAVRVNLVNHRFWFDGQQFLLPSEVCSVEMSYRSPVKMLLTGYRGLSLCPLALVTYLAKTHNDLLASYAQAFNEEISSKVALTDAKVVHLITTDAETNLLSIILANCEYSLKVGEGASVHYSYDAIQQQIVERMVQHKPLLLIPSAKSNEGELRRFLFHEDLTNGYKLEQLPKILQQEPLTAELKSKICAAYRNSVTDLSDSLSFVDQVIGFLITTRSSPDANLCSYARDCLRMNYNSFKHGALENLLVKHVRSLWLVLSMERSRVLITHHLSANRAIINLIKSEDCPWQTWFGDVSSRYTEGFPSTDDVHNETLEHLRRLNRNRIARSVLEILYEFITLRLSYSADRRSDMGAAAAEADEDEWYPVHYGLFSTLAAYADTFEPPYQPADDDTVAALGQLSVSCPQLQLLHALPTWVTLNCIVNNEM